MDDIKKKEILNAAKNWFKDVFIPIHIKNIKKLSNPSQFKINPFLVKYLAQLLNTQADSIAIAKALIYPRVLGTSVNTSFGNHVQKFISDTFNAPGSETEGVDIKFIDKMDGKEKFCQIKLGPNTLNKDDIKTIHGHFQALRNRSKTNNKSIPSEDLVVGVLYGEEKELSGQYKKLRNEYHYSVYVGRNFWLRLTGSSNFYDELIVAINQAVLESDGLNEFQNAITKLSNSTIVRELADID